ncbi:LysM peptidoglycan-binding domain-containing protein [Agaribacterium sp. ZY112]|uniref:lytic transglycosylase n=1 Tax=Agaribacterium sp. ZY112 TaxID=3233574 RepID=UPI003523AB79
MAVLCFISMRCCFLLPSVLGACLILSGCGLPLIKEDVELSHSLADEANPLDDLCFQTEAELDTQAAWQPYNLWQRVIDSYALEFEDNKRIQQQLKWYKKHPDYIYRVSVRGTPYLYYIVDQLDQRSMPAELAFLPIVESAFDPFAYSPGRASGMWQIIPGTGKMLGLKQSWWYDGRRDVVASTDAALVYLDKLQRQFDGDWLLALAAYNSGGGTVRKAIRKNKKKGKPTDYWSLDLPRETKDYVPRLLALATLMREAHEHDIELPHVANEAHFAVVDVQGQIDLAQAAELAELEMQEFYRLNPAFNRWATDPEGPHTLVLPIDKHHQFGDRLKELPAESRIKWQRHTIKSGETLSHIANKYGVSVATLQSVNRIKGHNIRAGKALLVPMASKGASFYSHSADQRLVKKQASGGKNGRNKVQHRVVKGDSFWSLSRRYGVSSSAIAKWNNMAPRDTLRLGQSLVIWTQASDSSLASTQAETGQGEQFIRKLNYRVRSGDSLSRIASKFSVSINDIVRWNSLNSKSYLQPGQRLVLYVDVKSGRG